MEYLRTYLTRYQMNAAMCSQMATLAFSGDVVDSKSKYCLHKMRYIHFQLHGHCYRYFDFIRVVAVIYLRRHWRYCHRHIRARQINAYRGGDFGWSTLFPWSSRKLGMMTIWCRRWRWLVVYHLYISLTTRCFTGTVSLSSQCRGLRATICSVDIKTKMAGQVRTNKISMPDLLMMMTLSSHLSALCRTLAYTRRDSGRR